MQARTQWINCDLWSELATMLEWSFKIWDRQNEKKWWNSDRRVICNAMHCIDAGCGVICHRGVSDSSEEARPLRQSHFAWMQYSFADGLPNESTCSRSVIPLMITCLPCIVYAMGPNSRVGSGSGSTWDGTMTMGLTTRTTWTVAKGPVSPPSTWHF